MRGPYKAEKAALEGALDHMRREGRKGGEVAIASDCLSLLEKLKKGIAESEGDARIFKKLGETAVGEIRYVKAHKGITEMRKRTKWQIGRGTRKGKRMTIREKTRGQRKR